METYTEHYDRHQLVAIVTSGGLSIPLDRKDIRNQKWQADKDRGCKVIAVHVGQQENDKYHAAQELAVTDGQISRQLEDIYDVLEDRQQEMVSIHTRELISDKKDKRAAYQKYLD
jgi:hypothetical protein